MTKAPRRILLIRPSALGDVCRSVPLAVSLKRAFPNADLHWLVNAPFADAIRAHPAVAHVVAFDRKALGLASARARFAPVLAWMNASLRAPQYDLVVDAQGLARSGLFAFWTRAQRRIGFADAREFGWLGLNERHRVASTHTVDRMLDLLAAAGIPPTADLRLYTPPEDANALTADPELAGRHYTLLAPTSAWPGKRWPADRFAEVARALLDTHDHRVVLVGSAHERPQCAPLLDLAAREPRVIDRIGKTTVGGLMALIQLADRVIANDSAALHIAVGFDRPLIALFGPTDVAKVGPYRRDADVLQHVQPNEHLDHKDETLGRALMERITTREVLDRITRLAATPAAAPPAPTPAAR